ncbi:MAG: RIP metalloprotease RseP [Verrucomicrobia bacterium]|nr:MAG: RIP metalloprotease RseP [Verrucomicrobiota bacterium]
MLTILYTIIVVILLLGATIFVHELGHFLVARWCGLVIDTFSIGFGHAIWKRKVGDVTYKIGWIPFGGYVALPQMDPTHSDAATEDKESRQLPQAAPWKKILVAIAGGIGNIIFAFVLAWIVYLVGKPSSPEERNCIIGYVDTNSAAYTAGLRIGDEITAINNENIGNWNELFLRTALTHTARMQVRNTTGTTRQLDVPVVNGAINIPHIEGIGPQNFCNVVSVMPGSSAEKAGIRSGDRVLEIAGQKLMSREHMISVVNSHRDEEVPVVVLRDGHRVELRVKPIYDAAIGRARIGIQFPNAMFDMDFDQIVHPKPTTQIREHAEYVFRVLKALTTPREMRGAAEGLGGPVMVLWMFWWAVKRGIMIALWFTCFFNVNLAVLNLLPIPILDGGHVIFALWEMITRRPLHAKAANIIMNFFLYLILLAAAVLLYRDCTRMIVPFFKHSVAETNASAVITNAPSPSR